MKTWISEGVRERRRNERLLLQVDSYIEGLFASPDPALEGTLRRSRGLGLPEMQVSPNEGRLLQLLAEVTGAKRIIDIL